MIDDNHYEPKIELDHVVDALRDLPLPSGPDDDFHRGLVYQLSASEQAPRGSEPITRQRSSTMRHLLYLAASVLAVSAVIGWLASLSGRSAGAAFARMLEQVSGARTVVYQTRIQIGSLPERQNKSMIWEPDHAREEMVEGDYVTIHIHDRKLGKWLTLLPAKKEAIRRAAAVPGGASPKNVIEMLREVREASAKLVGNEKIEGRQTRKYRCDHATGHYLIWVDAESDRPVRVEISESPSESKNFVKIVMTDFKWNVPLDESLFSIDIPKGYTVEEEKTTDPLDPKNFIRLLKTYVHLNGNRFPDEFNALSAGSMIKFLDDPKLPDAERMANYRRKLSEAFGHPEWERLSDEEWKKKGQEIGRIFAQGSGFLQMVALTHDWHYVGKGVKFGEADKIVAWWAPKPAGDATVLYGDFHLESKPTAGLPQ